MRARRRKWGVPLSIAAANACIAIIGAWTWNGSMQRRAGCRIHRRPRCRAIERASAPRREIPARSSARRRDGTLQIPLPHRAKRRRTANAADVQAPAARPTAWICCSSRTTATHTGSAEVAGPEPGPRRARHCRGIDSANLRARALRRGADVYAAQTAPCRRTGSSLSCD